MKNHTKLYKLINDRNKWDIVVKYVFNDPDISVEQMFNTKFIKWFPWDSTNEGSYLWACIDGKLKENEELLNDYDKEVIKFKYPEMFV